MRRLVGLEIATSGVRVVELNRRLDSDGFATIKAASFEPFPFDSPVVGGKITNKTAVAHAIREAVRKAGAPRRNIVVGIAADSYSAYLEIPAGAKDHEREFLIRTTGDLAMWDILDPKTARLSWRVVESFVNGEGKPREILGVAATDSGAIESLEETLDLAQVRPAAIDLSGAALVRALVRVPMEDRTVQTIVDIGASQTLVVTRVGPHPRSIQSVDAGGAKITEAIAKTMKISPLEAEEQKRHMEIPRTESLRRSLESYGTAVHDDKPLSEVEETLDQEVDALVSAIAELVDQDTAMHPSMPTQGVVLVGGGSRLRGMRERMAARLGTQVHLGQPWVADKFGKDAEWLAGNRRLLADLSVAVGLAMWGLVPRPSTDLL